MKSLDELYTPGEVDAFIAQYIEDDMPGLRLRAESLDWDAADLEDDPKLKAMVDALARRKELAAEIASGMRDENGEPFRIHCFD